MSEVHTPAVASQESYPARLIRPGAWFGWLYVIGGIIGIVCSAIITVEKMKLAEDPNYVTVCDINAVVDCGNVMASSQASVFGFANPIIGLAGFGMVTLIGAAVLAGGRFAGWFWFGAQLGMTFAVVFVMWLFSQAVYVIEALCPYCMAVWAVTIVMFVYLTAWNLKQFGPANSGAINVLYRSRHVITVVWVVAIAVAILVKFRDYL